VASDNRRALALLRRIDQRLSGRPVGSSVTELVARLPVAPADALGEEPAAAPPAAASISAA